MPGHYMLVGNHHLSIRYITNNQLIRMQTFETQSVSNQEDQLAFKVQNGSQNRKCIFNLAVKVTAGIVTALSLIVALYFLGKYLSYSRTVLFYPTLKLPIVYIWNGKDPFPQKYAQRLKKANFPYKILGEQQYKEFGEFYNFPADISIGKRMDALRLRYMWKYGGVAADLDYIIDYQCLMMKLQGLKGTYYSMEQDWHRNPTVSLMYASQPGDPILKQVTDTANQRLGYSTLNFMLGYIQKNFPLKSIDLDACAYHQYDGSWAKNDPNPF